MNKKLLCSLLLGTFTLVGCGNSNKAITPGPSTPDYSNLFTLNSPDSPACMVNEKVKQYTDAIYAQREAAGVDAADEDKIVDPLYGETAKIADYQGDYDECKTIELSFSVDDTIKAEEMKVKYWVEGKENNYKEVVPVDGKISLTNLYRSTKYQWQVISETGKESAVAEFETGDYVRFLNVGNIPNFRDNGGWTTIDGKRIKQGLVYRGYEMNDHTLSNGHAQNVFGDEDPAKDIFVKELGIRAEVDLRSSSEADNKDNKCCMNKAGVTESSPEFVTYTRKQIASYHDGLKKNKAEIKVIFEDYLANADQKPVYYHCYGGADRTGTIGFLLGAILGMSYTDLVIDYEATSFSSNLKQHDVEREYTFFPSMIAEIKSWSYYSDSKPLSEVIETYLTQDCNVASEKIAKIREIMLEDID